MQNKNKAFRNTAFSFNAKNCVDTSIVMNSAKNNIKKGKMWMSINVYNHSYLKNINRLNILQCIYKNEDVNRNYIVKKTGLTGAAVTKIIKSLTDENFVSEITYYSKIRKRKARYLKLSENKYGVVVIHIERDKIVASIVDINGTIFSLNEFGFSYNLIDENLIIKILDDLMKDFTKSMICLGCVIVTPGIVISDKDKKERKQTPFYWDFDSLAVYIKTEYDVNLLNSNDSNAALLGECWFGKAKQENNSVLYNIGKGVGAAAFVNGQVLKGYNNSSIEIGHTSIDYKGPKCSCGNNGCLELYISEMNWEKRLSIKEEYCNIKNIAETVFFNAKQGDKKAMQEIEEYADLISEGAITLANMFSPKRMILTTNGADYYNLSLLIPIIEKELNASLYAINKSTKTIEVVESTLRGKGYLLGGLVIVLIKIF